MHPLIFFLNFPREIKLYHWMTTSYPRHIASDALYTKIENISDAFVEAYLGRYERPKLTKKDVSTRLHIVGDTSFVKYLDACILYLTQDIMKYISLNDMDLINIRDEIITAINKTKYLCSMRL